jgi:hypothetical protein
METQMKLLPDQPHLDPLRQEAKDLLAAVRTASPEALDRLRATFPKLIDQTDFRLHDAQSVVAREYGFASWPDLKHEIERRREANLDIPAWSLAFVNACIGVGYSPPNLTKAHAMCEAYPDRIASDPWLRLMLGDLDALLAPNETGGPRNLHPLNALCQSVFLKGSEGGVIHAAVRGLLARGADPNVGYEEPIFPGSHLTPLYGAVGKHADADLGRILLEAGATPNDGESLYHSTEHGDPALIRLLLEFGAKVDGSNAMRRVLDFEFPEGLKLLLQAGGDPEARAEDPRSPICWAISRQRSPEVVRLLLEYGADPLRGSPHGISYFRLATERGLPEIAALFPAEQLSPMEEFVAAAMRGDELAARATGVTAADLRDEQKVLLSEAAAHGHLEAVRVMLKLGWPVGFPNRDWNASALNQAVFHGNAAMTDLLLAHGANWETERHGYGDNVRGTLDFGSRVRPVPDGDYLACARLLVAAGMTHGGKDWPDEIEALFDLVE